MPRPGIPSVFEPAVLEQAGKGKSHRDIAAWLKAEHGVRTTHVTVGKLLRRIRSEVGESTRAVAVSEVAPQVVSHIEGLNGVIRRARAIEDAAAPDPDAETLEGRAGKPALALKALEVQRRTHETVLRISGADGGAEQKAQTLADLLALAGS